MIQGEKPKQKKEKSYKKYHVDFNAAVSNNLVSLEAAIKYLEKNIKINGIKGIKDGAEAEKPVRVSSTDKKDKQRNTILVQADSSMKFSKRYIKYLVKKFLKRENISLYLRVIANGAHSYVVKLLNRNTE